MFFLLEYHMNYTESERGSGETITGLKYQTESADVPFSPLPHTFSPFCPAQCLKGGWKLQIYF